MVMPFITGDFFPGHLEEVAGCKYFALVKPNAGGSPIPNAGSAPLDVDLRGIVIGSTWYRCGASCAVAESSLAVADYLLGQHGNFLKFARQKDGATRCAQIVQLLLANHVGHDVSNPLVAVQLDASNAFCSVSRQLQFDVLAGKASRSYDDGRVQVGHQLPRPRTSDKYWGYFLYMQGDRMLAGQQLLFSFYFGSVYQLEVEGVQQWGGGEGGAASWEGGAVDGGSVNAFLAAALACVMRVAVPIPAVASASVFHSTAGGGSVVDVVRPL